MVVRIGLGYVKGVRAEEMEALVAERARGGPYRDVADLASRSGAGRDSLERLAWAGALNDLVRPDKVVSALPERADTQNGELISSPFVRAGSADTALRRKALWEAGIAASGRRHEKGTQMALPLETPGAPTLDPLGEWEEMIADYRSTGMTLGEHPMALMRDGLDPELLRSTDLEKTDDGAIVEVGGMVVARQRPETAGGVVFVLLEDERGTVNLIVPPPVYDRHRSEVRTSPLVRAKGRLERREGTTSVLVSEVRELERTQLREVVPPGHSWGRRDRESQKRPTRSTHSNDRD
jgi:error-prone DNA polymerase